MTSYCPQCKQSVQDNELQCSSCGFALQQPANDEANATIDLGSASPTISDLERFGNPFLMESLPNSNDAISQEDPNQSFGTLELTPKADSTLAENSEAVSSVVDIGTVDFDELSRPISADEIGTVDFEERAENSRSLDFESSPPNEPNGTQSNDPQSDANDSTLVLLINSSSPAQGPHGTVVDFDVNQTIDMDSTIEPSKKVGPHGTISDCDDGATISFPTIDDSSVDQVGPSGTKTEVDSIGTVEFSIGQDLLESQSIDRNSSRIRSSDQDEENNNAVAIEEESLDFDTSIISSGAGGTDDQGDSATIQLGNSLDFEVSDPIAGPSDVTINEEDSGVTIDANLLGPSNRHPRQRNKGEGDSSGAHEDQASHPGVTGTTGRVKRIWKGAGSSDHNPGNTLKASSQLASDDIFELVQPRIMIAQSISELVLRGAKNDKDKQLIEHCLTVACKNNVSDQADYEINGFLGKGAMGVVLQARQNAIGRDVAIKMVQPPSSGNATVATTRDMHRKFLYEAQVTGKLDHPNIVPVYELGTSNGALFYSMKKISGVEWTKKIKVLSQDENLDVLMKVADAMAFSHQRNIIHRDLKPDNVMLGAFGEVLVTDWGCAVDLNVQKKFSGAGSPPWMAPEMALQQHDILGPKSDMYLLGAILYQIITGHPPHPGRTAMEALMAAARNQIIEVENPDPLLDIAYRAMQTDPANRFANIESMQEAIREYRRHSESIAISQRCEGILASAIDSSDYEKFSRSIFGFQDALQLWPQNGSASGGLARARFAYGKCAFARKDYDLCLATLDRSVAHEEELYQQAVAAKQAVAIRERRFQTLRKAFAGAVLGGLAVSAILATVAWIQRNNAVTQKELAITAAKAESVAKEQAVSAKVVAESAKLKAEESAASERVARENEEQARKRAVAAQEAAEFAAESERSAKMKEQLAKESAQLAQKAAEESAIAERAAKLEAVQRSAQVELASMRSNLALALSQVERAEMGRARESLKSVVDVSSYQALSNLGLQPKGNNWAWNRVNLLSNNDLLQPALGDRIATWNYDSQANRGVLAGTSSQRHWLKAFTVSDGRITLTGEQLDLSRPATSVVVLGDQRTVAFTLEPTREPSNDSSTAFIWQLATGVLEPMNSVRNESLQGLAAVGERGLVGGLNQGLWYWPDVTKNEPPQRIRNIQGRLRSMQIVGDQQLVLLAESTTQSVVHWIKLDAPNKGEFMRIPISNDQPTAIAYTSGRLIVGMESGRIFSMNYSPSGRGALELSLDQLNELPGNHSSSIGNIIAHPDGTLLTSAREPVVRVWTPSQHASGWSLASSLLGPTSNIQAVACGKSSDQVMALAEDATSIVWDIQQQNNRKRIQRPMDRASGAGRTSLVPSSSENPTEDLETASNYDARVVAVATSRSGNQAVSILANGRLDRWNPLTGKSLNQTQSLAYLGHDPTAEFVDMDLDEIAGVMITSAKLPQKSRESSADDSDARGSQSFGSRESQRVWEFVKWDLASGQMIDRWQARSSEEQPVSLASAARLVLYGSDKQTVFHKNDHFQETIFRSNDFGSYFSSVNPKNPDEVMLVKLNGVVRLANVQQLDSSWKDRNRQLSELDFHRVATKSDRVVVGRWSPDGDHYYLIWESGRVTELVWKSGQLKISRDLHSADLKIDLNVSDSGQSAGVRITSRWNVDAKVRNTTEGNKLYVLVRFPGSDGLHRLTQINFPGDQQPASRIQASTKSPQTFLVLTDDVVPALSDSAMKLIRRMHPKFVDDMIAIRAIGKSTYCVSKQGQIYRLESERARMFGSSDVISGSGDDTAQTIVTLHEGGTLWRADWKDGWTWRQLAIAPKDAQRVLLSPDGSRVLILRSERRGAVLLSAESGQPIQQVDKLSQAVAAAWDRSEGVDRLAFVDTKGSVHLLDENGLQEIAQIDQQWPIEQLHFFQESWSGGKPPSRWLLATSRRELKFLEIGGKRSLSLELRDGITHVEPSPQEGILAIGGQGTLALYFCAPSLDEPGRELFSLSGHGGSNVCTLRFTQDGATLISADESFKQFSWISQ